MPPPNYSKGSKTIFRFNRLLQKNLYQDLQMWLGLLTNLTRLDQPFEVVWQVSETSFELLKEALIKEPILRFPDPNKHYILYTDASKYAWSCVLTQQYTHDIDNKHVVVNHPITYISGLFTGKPTELGGS